MRFPLTRSGGKEVNRAHLTEPVQVAVGFGRFFAFRCSGNGEGARKRPAAHQAPQSGEAAS
jgi:hypothetical protein